MSDGVAAWTWTVFIVVILGLLWVGGFVAGVHSAHRHLCLSQGLEWVNEEGNHPIPVEYPATVKVKCIEPTVEVSP